ncbi:uncharacterized protein BCR38DRAFT_676 [Pseudomassariella vexata]|uniref:Uncharacterized protein n=1 Tax=Pseudomassariella vexata TaxID=1141098 RepID=A0A1Y2EI42_9PEZI|nr:uncharacterized protein BCR38DRAFT_676 [Pseudomassariella vexata]ORY70916.1 hypothetical protein BCR38DRAFT_676 [Pseudomassariella vexata]
MPNNLASISIRGIFYLVSYYQMCTIAVPDPSYYPKALLSILDAGSIVFESLKLKGSLKLGRRTVSPFLSCDMAQSASKVFKLFGVHVRYADTTTREGLALSMRIWKSCAQPRSAILVGARGSPIETFLWSIVGRQMGRGRDEVVAASSSRQTVPQRVSG